MFTSILGDILITLALGLPVTYLVVGELLHQYALHHHGRLPEWLEGPPAPKQAQSESFPTPVEEENHL